MAASSPGTLARGGKSSCSRLTPKPATVQAGLGGLADLVAGGGGVDAQGVAFHQVVVAVVEGGEGDVAQSAVERHHQRFDAGGVQVGGDRSDQVAVERLGSGPGVAARVLQGGAQGLDFAVEFGGCDRDGVYQQNLGQG